MTTLPDQWSKLLLAGRQNCVQNVFEIYVKVSLAMAKWAARTRVEDARDCHETVMNLIVKFHFHRILPVKNKSGAYGARTRNLRRDRAAL